jgi:hypothetical protein
MKAKYLDEHQESLVCGPYCKQFNKICHIYSSLGSIFITAHLILSLPSVFPLI